MNSFEIDGYKIENINIKHKSLIEHNIKLYFKVTDISIIETIHDLENFYNMTETVEYSLEYYENKIFLKLYYDIKKINSERILKELIDIFGNYKIKNQEYCAIYYWDNLLEEDLFYLKLKFDNVKESIYDYNNCFTVRKIEDNGN